MNQDELDLAQIRLALGALFFAVGIIAGNANSLAADIKGALAAAHALIAPAGAP